MSPLLVRSPAILASAIFFTSPTSYLLLERYVSKAFTPYYSYVEHPTSRLGVPYAYKDPETGEHVNSPRASIMNLTFITNGVLYLAGHIFLLKATSPNTGSQFSTARGIVASLYCIGITLVAAFPGGPVKPKRGAQLLHGIGAFLAIAGGNVNAILAGLSTSADLLPIYRTGCLLLGTVGLSGFPIFFGFAGKNNTKGFWQRFSIYPIHAWDYLTAITLATKLI